MRLTGAGVQAEAKGVGMARRKAGVEYDLALAWATARALRTIEVRNMAAVICEMGEIVEMVQRRIVGDVVMHLYCWLCLTSKERPQARAASENGSCLLTTNPNSFASKFAPHDDSLQLLPLHTSLIHPNYHLFSPTNPLKLPARCLAFSAVSTSMRPPPAHKHWLAKTNIAKSTLIRSNGVFLSTIFVGAFATNMYDL
jgi:hypothetical protein